MQQGARRFLRPPRDPARLALVALLLVTVGTVGCGEGGGSGDGAGSGDAGGCGADTEEPIDPSSVQHLLPGAPEPAYSFDPPTSGAHLSGGAPAGVRDEPVTRPAQVALLEAGGVMVQYKDLSTAQQRRLRALAERQVVVAPNPGLTVPVVATAWRHRLECTSAVGGALDALESFIDTHKGKGPAHL